uniref:Potassium channel tetramerization domain containing 10 n=1 Tax=Pan troglodytes TaxID=9598 RepID=A0A2I3TWD9_PANTR
MTLYPLHWQEEMSGESVVSSAVPAAATRTTSFKGTSPSSKYVKLNVGGALYYTTMQTLTKQDTMLKAMFSGRMEVLTDSEERYLRWTLVLPRWGLDKDLPT